jgi:DNA transposition AAA+ family ATPase
MAKQAYNEELRVQLDAYRNSCNPPLTNRDLARELGIGVTQISKYLNKNPDWDVTDLESTIEDVLKAATLRRAGDSQEMIKTSVTQQINAVCETIRKTNDIGLIFGPAGTGKTVAIAMYAKEMPSAIVITLTKWAANAHGIERLIFEALETRTFKKSKKSRAGWLLGRLRKSNRILIVDNAHRLTKSGREWLFDFQDATGIPIALVGNPEVLDAIEDNDQQFSRIGIVQSVKLKDSSAIATRILAESAPAANEHIGDLVRTIASKKGHLRSLKKHLLLLPELLPAFEGDYRKAMLAAHTQLVSDYKLN